MIFANFSGGRDSTAMLIKWLEIGNNIDYIIFCDTGFEFQEMYEYIKKIDSYLQKNFNKSITILNPYGKQNNNDNYTIFENWAFFKPITRGEKKGRLRGLPMMVGKDFCTRETKIAPTRKFVISKSPNSYKNICLIGYTYDEVAKKGRVSNLDYGIAKYPLYEWKMNETEVTNFLSQRRIMNPLYNNFHRTGCFLCPKQSKQSLFHLYKFYPKEWQKMKDLEARARDLNCANQTFKEKPLTEYEKEFKLASRDRKIFNDDIYNYYETCFCGK